MIFPPSIKQGDTIGVVAPAGKLDMNIVEQACERIKSLGYKVKKGRFIENTHYNFSAPDNLRLRDLQNMLDDDDVKAIICTRGGYGCIRIIDRINFTRFIENPKWVVGFSDITVLHSAIQNLGIASIHGPMCKSFLDYTDSGVDVDILFSFLQGESPEYIINPYDTNKPGTAIGELIGGNLSLLYALRGTPFDMSAKGKILFIEDLSEHLYHLDRMMNNLRISGLLGQLSGIIVGQFTEMKDNDSPFGESIEEIILRSVKDYDIPVAFNFPSGHVDTNYPLILGDKIELMVNDEQVSLRSV